MFELFDHRNKMMKLVLLFLFSTLCSGINDDFYAEEPYALVNNNCVLVCKKKINQNVYLLTDKKIVGGIVFGEIINLDKENYDITGDESKVILIIKKVTLKDEETIFGCNPDGGKLFMLTITVNVPVTSVSLHQEPNSFLFEDKNGTFVCKVDESKPKASFQWILSENGSERVITQNIDITSKQNGKVWQTTSTLKLKLKRSFKTIKCRAKIQGMAWTNSTSLRLDVKYPPPGTPLISVSRFKLCAGEPISISCEWKGGHPNASVNLTCLSQTKTNEDSVMITETVTREMSNRCRCEGKHVAKNVFNTYNISIEYPPNKVEIHQTSYLKGKPSSLICVASGGSPDVYTYSWLPGNYLPKKERNINLTQVSDQQFTCTVAHKCGRNNLKSSPTKIIVEDYPIIKMPNRITVIENETVELKCLTEGNPEPINMWRIGNKIINSRLLKTSFTRQNASGGIQCIAIAKSAKHGILETVKNISIVVTYSPKITISYENLEIRCSADASPSTITYEFVQKWGNIEKRRFNGNKMFFSNLTYQDSGEWICRASNGVLTKTKKKYSEKSVEVKVDVSAQFSGDETQQAISRHEKSIKVCFYCHPEAEAVEWHSEHGKISSNKSVSSPAEEGPFPFTGNCSSLTLDITETSAKNYELIVTNKIGKRNFSVNLDIKKSDDNILIIIILAPTIAALIIIIIIGVIIRFKYRSHSIKKKAEMKSNNPPTKMGETVKNDRPLPNVPPLDIYDNSYDTLEMPRKEDEPTEGLYHILEKQQKGDELEKHTYLTLEAQQKGDEQGKHTYLTLVA